MKPVLRWFGLVCALTGSAAFAQTQVTITTGSPLPNATLGVSYSVQLSVSGGNSPYSWGLYNPVGIAFVAPSALPPGLSLSSSGAISGTPTQAGTYGFSVIVGDTERPPQTATARFQITVQTPSLTITSSSQLPGGSMGAGYSFNFTATGGVTPYIWSVYTGRLPAGLTLSTSGALTGTLPSNGQYSFTVSVTDSSNKTNPQIATQTVSLVVGPSTTSGFAITSMSPLANSSVGAAYSFTFAATGGVTPYNWIVSSGSVPPGLTLSTSGALTGTPTATGTYSFTVQATDSTPSAPHTATQMFTLRITPQLTITTPTPLSGTAGSALDIVMTATGGVLPEIWQVAGGSQLPTGLTLDTISGFLQGTPPAAGTFTFTVQVTDNAGNTATAALVLIVAPAISITTVSPLTAASTGVAYTATFAAAGGNSPYMWKVDSGALPAGLTLDPAAGTLSGTAATAGSYSFVIRVTDTSNATVTKPFTLAVNQSGPGAQLSTSNLSFTAMSGGDAPSPQNLALIVPGAQTLQFTIQIDGGSAGVAAPTWLSVKLLKGSTPAQIPVAVDQTGLAVQTYSARILVNTTDGRQNIVTVTLTVTATPAQLDVLPTYLRFSATPTVPAGGQTLYVRNSGGGGPFSFQATVTAGASWLTVTPASGQTASNAPVPLQVQVTTQGLPVGARRGAIRIDSAAGSITISVSLLVRSAGAVIGLDGQGVQFRDRAGNGDTQFRDVHVLNLGDGLVNWAAEIVSDGTWLSLGATSGQASPGSGNLLRLNVATGGLDPGAYYALVRISDPNALNSPQYFTAVLNVQTADTPPTPWPVPEGIVYVARAGTNPAAQPVTVYVSSSTPVAYQAAANTSSGGTWLSVSPATGTTQTQPPAQVSIAVNAAGLAAGVYTGSVTFSLSSTAIQTTNVTLIVQPALPASGSAKAHDAVAGCTPSKLALTSTGLNNSFASPAGWPTPLAVALSDDCGSPVVNGQVVVTFTSGDPALAMKLTDPNAGTYSATWSPKNVTSAVTVTARANAPSLASASADIGGAVTANKVPVLLANGTVNNFNVVAGAPLAPGTVAAVFGAGLAPSVAQPGVIPLPSTFNGTQVLVGAFSAPLYFLSDGQLDVQLPTELAPNQDYSIVVAANGGLTLPDTITTTGVDPAVVVNPDSSVIAEHLDFSLITAVSPAASGETITLFLAGMGATNPPVASGVASPSSPLARVTAQPTVTIDGQQATVVFAGLTPGAAGLYQINVTVPAGLPAGQLPVVITQSGVTANAATLPVK
jgi:uncharacterized protein (TIGR03437 family)